MEIVFVRHAQNERDGSTDPPLTELGKKQVEHLVHKSATWPRPTEILVSPALRARQTAAPLAAALEIEPSIVPWLEEIRFPQGLLALTTGHYGVPDATSFETFRARVTEGLAGTLAERGARPEGGVWILDAKSQAQRIVFVGHGGSNAVALEHLLGIASVPWSWYRFSFVHTATSRVVGFPVGEAFVFSLVRHGDTSHLPRELRSH